MIEFGYESEDIEILQELNIKCYEGEQRAPRAVFKDMLTVSDVWLDRLSNSIIAFLLVSQRARGSYLWSVAVYPEYRGLGVGSALIETAKEYLKSRGEQRWGLHVHVNNPAQKLYFDQGFRAIRVEPRYFLDDGDGIYMEGEL